MTTPPIRRSSASPPAPPSNPVDLPARVGQVRAPPEPQGPAPLRRRTDLGRAEGSRRPAASLSARAQSPRDSASDTPSGWPPPLHAISLPSIAATSPSSSGGVGIELDEAEFDDAAAEPVLPTDREPIEGLVARLREVAAGAGTITAVGYVGQSTLLRTAFERDSQLRPPQANEAASSIHLKLGRLRRSAQADDRRLVTAFDAAMLEAGQRSWRRTAEIVQGLIAASDLLNPPDGRQRPSKAAVIRQVGANRAHVEKAVKHGMTREGRLMLRDATNVAGILEQVDRMRRHSPDGDHAALLVRWDAFLRGRPRALPRRTASAPAPKDIDWQARVEHADRFIAALDLMRRGQSLNEACTRAAATRGVLDRYGDLTAKGETWIGELHESPRSPDRAKAGDMKRASADTVHHHRESLADLFTDLARAVEDLRSGACVLKKHVEARFRDRADKTEALLAFKHAVSAQGQLAHNPVTRTLLTKLDWLRGSDEPQHLQAIRDFEAALRQPHHVLMHMPAQSLNPDTYRAAPRAQAQGRQPAGGMPGSARSGTGAGFDAGEEVQSHPAAAPGSPWMSLEGALAHAGSPSFDLPSLREGRSASPSVDFDALPALSGVQLSLDSELSSGTLARPALDAYAAPDNAVRRANATRDWVRSLIANSPDSQRWPADFRHGLIQQAVDVELNLFAHDTPPLADMLQNHDRRLWRLVSEEQAGAIQQIDELLRPREA